MADIVVNIGGKSKRKPEEVLVRMPIDEAKMMKGVILPVQDQLEDLANQQRVIYELIIFPKKYAMVNRLNNVVDNIIVYHPELNYIFHDHKLIKIDGKCKIGMKYEKGKFYKDNIFYRIRKWMNI